MPIGILFVQVICLVGAFDKPIDEKVPYFASGFKVGEVDQTSAIVWVRLTKNQEADFSKLSIFTEGLKANERPRLEMPTSVVPGVAGQARVLFWESGYSSNPRTTQWFMVDKRNDCIHQFKLNDLKPGKQYEFEVQAKLSTDSATVNSIRGQLRTAFDPKDSKPVRFIVSTCQAIRSIDSGKNGHVAYQQMLAAKPDFFVHTGDILYYDKVPFCKNLPAARAKWNLMFSYHFNREFHRKVGSYFMKDDHDTLKNDCWPGQKYGDLTFDQGLKLFREQVCMGEKTYRTVRWGKDLQIWMTENRDFRSSNRMPDGPGKTILGAEQKKWLFDSVASSNATFKFIISPGPIVGPDKKGKNDNHSNPGFHHEGKQLREFIAKQKNTYVICGDRHWQYCSKDPVTGILEFGCGPVNDEHKFGGNPGRIEQFHRYFGAKGGFMMVSVEDGSARVDWYHANAESPTISHSERLTAK